jgi:probable F420-dependent oxidoreductase
MRVGLCAYNMEAAELLDLAVHADRLGFDGIWLGEHVLLPVGYSTAHPTTGTTSHRSHAGPIVGEETVLVDPLLELAAIASRTSRIGLGTAMFILPLRHPLLVARAVCTLQELSANRLSLGVGAGWLEEEFAAVGVEFGCRASRFGEMIDIIERALSGGPFSYDGKHFEIAEVQITPEPAELQLIFAGNTEKALKRAVTRGDGWFASGIPAFEEALRLRDRVRALREQNHRSEPFRTIFRMEGADPDEAARYTSEGLDDIVVWADRIWKPEHDREENCRRLEEFAAALGLCGVSA